MRSVEVCYKKKHLVKVPPSVIIVDVLHKCFCETLSFDISTILHFVFISRRLGFVLFQFVKGISVKIVFYLSIFQHCEKMDE